MTVIVIVIIAVTVSLMIVVVVAVSVIRMLLSLRSKHGSMFRAHPECLGRCATSPKP